jgi:hypothetical protein
MHGPEIESERRSPVAAMRIAKSTLAVAGLLEHLPPLISGIYKDAYKRFLALLRHPTATKVDARSPPCLSLNPKEAVQSI